MSDHRYQRSETTTRVPGGERIRNLRILLGMTQRDLANLLAVHFTYISKIENGDAIPGKDTVRKMAAIFNVGADDLLEAFGHMEVERLTREQDALKAENARLRDALRPFRSIIRDYDAAVDRANATSKHLRFEDYCEANMNYLMLMRYCYIAEKALNESEAAK